MPPAEVLTPVEVTIDAFGIVMSGPDVVDITLLYTARYVDPTFSTVASRQASTSAIPFLSQEQFNVLGPLLLSLKHSLHIQVVGE